MSDPGDPLALPRGDLVRSRVVAGPGEALSAALSRSLTGYALLSPQEALLLGAEGEGVLTFDAGVPVLAYHTGTGRGGPAALADLAEPGPLRAELYAAASPALERANDTPELAVPPGMPAERLAGDPDLADRTRAAAADAPATAVPGTDAPDDTAGDAATAEAADRPDPVASFLADEEKVAAIQERAREEAERRAAEWGLDDELV